MSAIDRQGLERATKVAQVIAEHPDLSMYKKHGSDFDSWEFKLDRTENAIRVQARRMGLCRPRSHTGMSTRQRENLLKGFRILCDKIGCNMHAGMVELCRMDERGMM